MYVYVLYIFMYVYIYTHIHTKTTPPHPPTGTVTKNPTSLSLITLHFANIIGSPKYTHLRPPHPPLFNLRSFLLLSPAPDHLKRWHVHYSFFSPPPLPPPLYPSNPTTWVVSMCITLFLLLLLLLLLLLPPSLPPLTPRTRRLGAMAWALLILQWVWCLSSAALLFLFLSTVFVSW